MNTIFPEFYALLTAITVFLSDQLLATPDLLSSLPPAVQKTARAQIGKSEIKLIKNTDQECAHGYEVEFTRDGENVAAIISERGALIQLEHRPSLETIPEKVKEAASHQVGGTISSFKKLEKDGKVAYEVTVMDGSITHEVSLDENAQVIKTNDRK